MYADLRAYQWYLKAPYALLQSLLHNVPGNHYSRRGNFAPWGDLSEHAKNVLRFHVTHYT